MSINNWAITAILVIKSIMAVMASVLDDPKYEFFGCLVKEWSKCRTPVKRVFKRCLLWKVMTLTKQGLRHTRKLRQ